MPLSYRELSKLIAEPVSVAQAKQHLNIGDDFTDDDSYISSLITAARQYVERYTHRAIYNRKMILTLDYFPWPGWGTTTGCADNDYYLHWYFRGLSIRLPLPATASVESVSYLAPDGVTPITISPANYRVDTLSEPARISPAPGYTWPYQQNYVPGQVQIRYTAGTYELPIAETFIVPASGTYSLQQADILLTFLSVTDANGNPVQATANGADITVDTSLAGQTLTANYTVDNCPQTIKAAMLLLIGHWYEHRLAVSTSTMSVMPMAVESLLAGEVFDTFGW